MIFVFLCLTSVSMIISGSIRVAANGIRLFFVYGLVVCVCVCVCVCGGGLVAQSCPTLATPWTVAHQAALSMGYSLPGDVSGKRTCLSMQET